MAKGAAPAAADVDPRTTDRQGRRELEEAVAKAQRDALPKPRDETPAETRRRLERDRAAVVARHEAVADAQLEEGHAARKALEALTPAERAARREEAKAAKLAAAADVDAAIKAEGRRLAGLEA